MKKRHSDDQKTTGIIRHQAGSKVADICRRVGVPSVILYNWRSKYVGLEVSEAKLLCEIEQIKNKLKRLLAEKLSEVDAIKFVLSK